MSEEQRILRRVHDPATREVLREAFQAGCRWKARRHGIVIFGDDGETAACHFTPSDCRAASNFRARLKKIGVVRCVVA